MYTYVLLRNSLVVAHCCLTRDSNSVGVTGRPEASSFSPSTNLTSQNLKKHSRELMIKNHHFGLKTEGTEGTTLLNLLPEIQKFFRATLSRERGEINVNRQTTTPFLSFSHHKWTIPDLILTTTGPGWAKYRDLSVGNKTICHFHTRTIARRRKEWFIYTWPEYYLQPNTVRRHCAGANHYLQVTWWALGQWKGRKICIPW